LKSVIKERHYFVQAITLVTIYLLAYRIKRSPHSYRLHAFVITVGCDKWHWSDNITTLYLLKPVFLNRRAAARYRALASIIPDHERP